MILNQKSVTVAHVGGKTARQMDSKFLIYLLYITLIKYLKNDPDREETETLDRLQVFIYLYT